MFQGGGKTTIDHNPTFEELKIISQYKSIIGEEYQLIRVSPTMRQKATIDASGRIRQLLKENNIVDYNTIGKGPANKLVLQVGLFVNFNEIIDKKISFYRPETKDGDPRFWIYGAGKLLTDGELIFITAVNGKLVIVPVKKNDQILNSLSSHFADRDSEILLEKIKTLCHDKLDDWIVSTSPLKSNPKDVGETFENILGITANSDNKADIEGEIEIKSKREMSKTKLSLFSNVPDWKISPIKSSREMILKFGYDSIVHPGFKDLYVTVSNEPNNQGLFIENDYKREFLVQHHSDFGETCYWQHERLQNRLFEKHPNTIWVEAEEKVIGGQICFRYRKDMIFTSRPIFSQFISLIDTSIITFDWRGKVMPDGSKYRDHGHGFRMDKSNRSLLFDENIEFSVT